MRARHRRAHEPQRRDRAHVRQCVDRHAPGHGIAVHCCVDHAFRDQLGAQCVDVAVRIRADCDVSVAYRQPRQSAHDARPRARSSTEPATGRCAPAIADGRRAWRTCRLSSTARSSRTSCAPVSAAAAALLPAPRRSPKQARAPRASGEFHESSSIPPVQRYLHSSFRGCTLLRDVRCAFEETVVATDVRACRQACREFAHARIAWSRARAWLDGRRASSVI